jgi:hypothetical protein
MTMTKFSPLAAPFDQVRFSCCGNGSHLRLTYAGIAADLLACGAIEPGMESPAPNKRERRDSHGDRFFRDSQPHGRLRMIRLITSIEHALALPGVSREDIWQDAIWLQDNPGRLRVVEDEWRIYCLGSRVMLEQAGLAAAFSSDWCRGVPRAHPIMGGFFAVTVEKHNSDPTTDPTTLSVAEQLVKRPMRACLRLVVDNTGSRGQESRS